METQQGGVRTARKQTSAGVRLRIAHRKFRYVIRRDSRLDLTYRVVVGVLGAVVLVCGIIAIPYPGPGWLIVFLGLGILASEFAWAHRLLHFARGKYDRWVDWIKEQNWAVQGTFALGTCLVVIGSLWLLGALQTFAGWVNIHHDWLASPIFS